MISEICEADSKINIPEEDYFEPLIYALHTLLGIEFQSERQKKVLVTLYLFMSKGEEWTAYKLFRALTKDPSKKKMFKSHTSLLHHLEQLAKLGYMKKIEGDVMKFSLDDALSEKFNSLTQIVRDEAFRDQFFKHYSQIYIILCSTAREVKCIFPDEENERIFELSRSILEIGVKLAMRDLLNKQVLVRQCTNCYYPYQCNSHPDSNFTN